MERDPRGGLSWLHGAGSNSSASLTEHRDRISTEIGAALTPLPQPGAESLTGIRQSLNARRYVDRALGRIAASAGPS